MVPLGKLLHFLGEPPRLASCLGSAPLLTQEGSSRPHSPDIAWFPSQQQADIVASMFVWRVAVVMLGICAVASGQTQVKPAIVAERESVLGPCPLDLTAVRELTDAIRSGDPLLLMPENVDHMNSLQVAFSSRFVMSATEYFELAKRLIRMHPELKQSPRLTVH